MTEGSIVAGTELYRPSAERVQRSRLYTFAEYLEREHGVPRGSYQKLWRFSVDEIPTFWRALADFFDVHFVTGENLVLAGAMPDAHWFPGATLNYAEHALRGPDEALAVIACSEGGARRTLTFGELRSEVQRVRAGLVALGVGRGDRVAALLPNGVEALVTFLATASLGAVFSSCSPEFGLKSVLDRFRQIRPRVLVAVDGYRYGGKAFDRSADVAAIFADLEGARAVVLPVLADEPPIPGALSWAELSAGTAPLTFEPVPFEHPLWILYSSGTTGLPKAIVQGHGGILLEHMKALALHSDLGPGDRFFWFSTTGWMMWNYLVSGLTVGATIVLYDGSPAYPSLDALWAFAETERLTYFGTSAPFLLSCQKRRLVPKSKHDFSSLRAIGSTGAPLPANGFAWVYQNVKDDLLLASVSGGTDVCTAFLLSCPMLPVRAGEIQCAGLGAKVESFDPDGQPVTDEVGELVLTAPLPSMPVSFWGDDDGSRLREAYFSTFPGVWRHGDWVKLTSAGSAIIYGRSDSTLNRGGVRMGTSEFYRVIEAIPEIADSLVVDTGSLDGDVMGKLWLFVVLAGEAKLDQELERRIRTTLVAELSPRHAPDEIRAISVVPRTLNGKKLEVPVKRILLGTALERAVSRDTLADPGALDPFVALAAELGTRA